MGHLFRFYFRNRIFLCLFFFVASLKSQAQVTLTASAGTASGSFSTLKGAFDAINAGTHQGTIVIHIDASTTETASAALNASGSGSSSYSSINIYPTTSGLSISGALATPLIDLNGADNVTIDGRVNATGSTKSLEISNTSTSSSAGTSTIRFINDASNNTVKYSTLKGSSTDASAGIVFLSGTTSTTGNDNNSIDNNFITCAADASRPLNTIFALGTSNKINDNNTISNNNIYNFLNKATSSNGINISSYNSSFTISGNSFYETASFTSSASVTYNIILISSVTGGGNGFTLSGNFIGGSLPLCAGSAWTKSSMNTPLTAISVTTENGTVNNLQGNTIQNISWANSGTASFSAIYLSGATAANIGTVTGNTIGATSGTGSIQITTNGSSSFYGINIACSGTVDCQANNISSITTGNASTSNTDFYGIYRSALSGNVTISNNTIGSNTTAGSINATSSSTSVAQSVYGIYNITAGTLTISGNIVANMVNATNNSTVGTLGLISGIYVRSSTNTISGNNIHDLSIANSNNVITYQASVSGISMSGLPTTSQTVSNNTIYNLSNSNSSFTGSVIGIFYGGPTTVTCNVNRNFIHSLSVTGATSTSAKIYGIKINAGATTYSNNIISLGGDTKTDIYGIFETGGSSNDNNLYFNTIYLYGSLVSGATNFSYAIYSAVNTNARNFRNNLLVNTRSTISGVNRHYTLFIPSTGGTLTLNFNNYYVSGTGGVLGYYGTNVSSLPLVTGQDVNSIVTNPSFNSPGTIASGYAPTVLGTGVTVTGITVDYNGNTRSSLEIMGAIYPCSQPTNGGTIAAAQNGSAPFDPVAFTSTASASGQTGTLEYKWQSSTTNSTSGFSDIASSNAATYDAGSISVTTWYKRLARVSCISDWSGALESNVLEVTIITPKAWIGGSGNWSTTSNWSDGIAPVSSDQLIISSGSPQLDVDFTVGGSLTLSGSASMTVNPGKTLTIAGTADFGAKSVTFKSDATSSGQLGIVAGTLSNATNVTVERHIPSGKRAFRFLSSPVTTTTSIRQNWMEGSTPSVWSGYPYTTTSFYNINPGYGTQISGSGGPSNGFDETLFNNPSLFSFNNSNGAWEAITSTAGTITAGTAYRMLVRGDRSYNMALNYEPVGGATILRATGTLAQGQLTTGIELPALSQSADGWSLVGNPYQSVVDLYSSEVVKTNLTDYYYIWDPRQATRGAYVAYNMTLSIGGSNNLGSGMTRFVQPGQAFFVQNTSTGNGSMVFKEAAKGSASEQTATFGNGVSGVDYSSLSTQLFYTDSLAVGRGSMDGIRVLFGKRFSNAVNAEDGRKFTNPDETMSIKRNTDNLSMELRSTPDTSTVVPLNISQYRVKRYTLRFVWDQPLAEDMMAIVKDKYLGKEILINQSGFTDVEYVLDAKSASSATDRFEVVFKSTVINLAAIAGISEVCVGASAQLYNATPGGTWSSKNPAIVSIDANGNFKGLTTGSTELIYTVSRYGNIKSVSQLVSVNSIPAQPTITRNADGQLVSSSTTGNQWYNQSELIVGANTYKYKPANPSYYRVRVVQNGCVGELSNSFYYTTGPLLDAASGTFVRIFPNPIQSDVKIEYVLKDNIAVRVEVYDIKGKRVLEYKNVLTGSKLNMTSLAAGVYRFRVMNSNKMPLYSYTVIKY